MKIPAQKLNPLFLEKIASVVGSRGYSVADKDRLSYSRDANFRSTIQAHYLIYEQFPSIIVWPENTEQISKIIRICLKHKVPIITYGGGSGVCAGALPLNRSLMLDVKRLKNFIRLDENKLTAEAGAGILGLELEKKLSRKGFTLGHFPVSILNATLGGYVATRAAGQRSSKFGKIEDMIIDLEFVDGKGRIWQTSDVSRTRGLNITELIVGCEGTFGIITKVKLKIFPNGTHRTFRAYSFNNLTYGLEAQRRIIQTGMKPDILRLYDKLDTAIYFSKMSSTGLPLTELPFDIPKNVIKILRLLKSGAIFMLFRYQKLVQQIANMSWLGCMMICMLEGPEELCQTKQNIVHSICKDMGARDMGARVAEHWFQHRFSVPFKIPKMFQNGGFTDTVEVTTTWDNVERLYNGVLKKLSAHCLVFTHITHVYTDGVSIYFSFVAPLKGPQHSVTSYDHIWQVALDAIQEFGGILSHHHGIGRQKTSHIADEWADAMIVYKHTKEFFDPHKILNPGVLVGDKP
ncbi:MAG: FAD-binding oxidoreductase [bacterium]|nr:FAD-binding oxidoreductase [bacterium]MBU1918237.1 FAD-binding oxidoreductase [bacterium]